MTNSPGERSAAWSAAGGVLTLLGVGAAIPLWLLSKHSDWELALSILSTIAIGLGLYWMIAALIALWPFSRVHDAPETRYRIEQRRQFARHVQNQLQQLAGQENWRDERFADLEAEVEVEGRQRRIPWLRHSPPQTVVLRREKSLSRALERSVEPLIVLEGDPGAGKSVALRHLAEQLTDKARRSPETSNIPLYINLKEFRPECRPVDNSSVHDFIFASVVRVNDRDVERFMDEEFDRGLRDGSWLILLDSFDEIPDILSSTEADIAVKEYALAIHNFLFGMRKSRAIVASREFHGPNTFREPRFQIVALSSRRQADLIRRSGLRPNQVRTVEDGLATADPEIRQASTSPMFLGLICDYTRSTGNFPESSHSVYESYLSQRFLRDADRLQQRYKVSAQLVRSLAEEIAFAMAAIPGLGLSPTRQALHSALIGTDQISLARLDAVLDALEYTKLGRAAEEADGSGQPSFTFAHRRFQEYFATRVVIRDPERVSVTELLTDGRWRETAVTILQTQPAAAIIPLLDEATRLLAPMTGKAIEDEELQAATGGYCWPPGSMHLLGVINAGLGQIPDSIPAQFRASAASLLMSAWNRGRRHDKKWVASLALVARKDETIWLLEQAFAAGSIVLGGEAYTCVSRLADPPANLYVGVQKTLVDMAASGDLADQKAALNAQVRRLPNPARLIKTLRLLSVAPKIDDGLAAIQVLICAALAWPVSIAVIPFMIAGLMGYRLMLLTTIPYRVRGIHLVIRPNSRVIWAVVFYSRAIAAIITIQVTVNGPTHNALIITLASIAGAYFVVWPLAVGYVCKNWGPANEFLWPFIPLFALAGVLRKLALEISKMSASYLSRLLLGLVLFGILIWAGVAYLPAMARDHRTFAYVIAIIGACIGFACLIIFICLGAFYLVRRHNDTRLVHSFFAKRHLTSVDVLAMLDQLKTPHGVRLFIEMLLQVDLIAYPEIIRMLSDIAAATEVAQKKSGTQKKDREAIVVPGVTPEFADWLKASHVETRWKALGLHRVFTRERKAKFPFAIRNVQMSMLDQIARTIEQIEISRDSFIP